MNDLVQLTTNDITRAEPITTTRIIADTFSKKHFNILKLVRGLIADPDNELFDQFQMEAMPYVDGKGREYYEYRINRDQYAFIVMGFTGKDATKFKIRFIKAFNSMERELLARSDTRAIGKRVRFSMTDSISTNLEDGTNHKRYAYSNYSKLVYKKVLGMTVKKFKAKCNLPDECNIRDHLNANELNAVQELETKIATLIEGFATVMSDKETYKKIAEII